jgi:hypothetical protein
MSSMNCRGPTIVRGNRWDMAERLRAERKALTARRVAAMTGGGGLAFSCTESGALKLVSTDAEGGRTMPSRIYRPFHGAARSLLRFRLVMMTR